MPIDSKAEVSPKSHIPSTSFVWAHAMIRAHVRIGEGVTIGRAVYVGPGVEIGRDSRIQNQAQIYEPATVGKGVLIGPNVVLTNDKYPRALNPSGEPKDVHDWQPQGVILQDGCSIGAQAVCVGPVNIGKWAMVAAGSVVTRDVGDFQLVGGVPARHLGWVGHAGFTLKSLPGASHIFVCPATGRQYSLHLGQLIEDND